MPDQPPANQPPANQPPANQPPANQPPANQPPANQPPANQPPANQPPANQPPANQPPANQPPANQPPANQPPANQPPANQPPANQPPANQPPANQSTGSGRIFDVIRGYLYLFLIGFVVYALVSNNPVIARLAEPGFARGLITFLISVATIGLAFVLVYQADGSTDDSFRRAREIFTGLMGVLGTIVGFYFGSAEKGSTPLEVAAIKSADKELVTHVSGGSPPYHYVVKSTDRNFKEISNDSADGWIVEVLDQPPRSGTSLTIDVSDSKEQKQSRKIDFPSQLKSISPPATSPPATSPPATSPPAT